MADTQISNLSTASALVGTERIPLSDGTTVTKGGTPSLLKTYVNTAPVFAAGSASTNSWPTMTAGTLMTTPQAGTMEMDATNLYFCTDSGNRGYVPVKHFIRADASRTLSSSTARQALFNSPANGRVTLEVGTYRFEGLAYLSGLSSASGNVILGILGSGTATCANWILRVVGIDALTPGTGATQTGAWTLTAATTASALTAGTGTVAAMDINGTVKVTGAGTVIPSVTLVSPSSNTPTLAAGSYLSIERMGSTTLASVGQWD